MCIHKKILSVWKFDCFQIIKIFQIVINFFKKDYCDKIYDCGKI